MTKPKIEQNLKILGYDWVGISPEDVGEELKKQKAECWSIDIAYTPDHNKTIKCFYDNKELTIDIKSK
jgi:hypothetical protein